jgi:hypothetical protein
MELRDIPSRVRASVHGGSPWRILTGRSIFIVEDEPLIALELAQAFERVGARVTVTRTRQGHCAWWRVTGFWLRYSIMRWAMATALNYARSSRTAGFPSCSTAKFSQIDGWLPRCSACGQTIDRSGVRDHAGFTNSPIKSNLSGHRRGVASKTIPGCSLPSLHLLPPSWD